MSDKATREEVLEAARAAGAEASRATLVAVGINPDDPIGAQETMTALRKVAKQENIEAIYFARRMQRTCESTRNRVVAGAGAVVYAWLAGIFDPVIKKFGGG